MHPYSANTHDAKSAQPLACHVCNYDIANLSPQETCPECGTKVQQSQLAFLDHERWEPTSAGHRRGFVMLIAGCLLFAMSVLVLAISWSSVLRFLGSQPLVMIAFAIGPLLIGVGGLMMARRPEWLRHGEIHFDRTMTAVSSYALLSCTILTLSILLPAGLGLAFTGSANLLGCGPLLFAPIATFMTIYFALTWRAQRREAAAYWYFHHRRKLFAEKATEARGPSL